MRLVLLNENVIGEELAMPIYLTNGMVFANEGVIINDKNLETLRNIGIETAYIKDSDVDVDLKELVKTSTILEVINELKAIFDFIKKRKSFDEKKTSAIVDKIIKNLDVSENSFLLNNIGRNSEELKLVTHSINVAILSLLIGNQKKFKKDKLHKLAMGALLHDVGKLFTQGEEHAEEGYKFIKNSGSITATSYMCILQHHEKQDGSGYPSKIPGNKISELASIVSICNEYSNLLQQSEFALPSMAIEYITSQVGRSFSEETFKVFRSAIYCYPNGLHVQLNNGIQGTVILQNSNFPARPVIGTKENGKAIMYNLIEDLTLFVEKVIL